MRLALFDIFVDTYSREQNENREVMFNFNKSEFLKNLALFIGVVIFSGVAYLCFSYFFISDPNAANYYIQGTDFLRKNDYQNAFYNYSKIKKNSEYYPIALYRQAHCASQLGDTKTGIEKRTIFIEKYPNSLFTPKMMYELAKDYFDTNEMFNSEQLLIKIKEAYPNSDYDVAANYFLGMIKKSQAKKPPDELVYSAQTELPFAEEPSIADNYNQDMVADATKQWLTYLEKCPKCRYSKSCIEEIVLLNKHLMPEVNSKLGVAFYENDEYTKAADYLQRGIIPKYWTYLYLSERSVAQDEEAKKVFEENFPRYARSVEQAKLNTAMSAYVNSFDKNKKEVWQNLLKLVRQTSSPSEDYILYNLALISSGEERMGYFGTIVQQFPKSDYAPEASWELFRNYYMSDLSDKAILIGERHISYYPKSASCPAVMYWLGKIYHNQKMAEKAKYYYQRVMNEFPDEYYAFRAASMYKVKSLNWHNNAGKDSSKLDENTNIVTLPFAYSNWSETDIALIKLALNSGDLDILDDIQIDNKIIQSWILYKNGNFSTAAVYARDWIRDTFPRPAFDQSVYKLAYPLLYTRQIMTNCQKLNLDMFLILALMKEESFFNKDAVSSSGAMGLMQIMPDTAKHIASVRNIPYTSKQELLDPDFNIMLGCNYFDYVKKLLKNSNLLTVAAYNGGPGSVDFWLKSKNYTDFDEFVEDIPYPETKSYVKKVYKAYWNYLNIYE